jgi:hypothetical protein
VAGSIILRAPMQEIIGLATKQSVLIPPTVFLMASLLIHKRVG